MASGEDKPDGKGADRGSEPEGKGPSRFSKSSDPFDEEVNPRSGKAESSKGRRSGGEPEPEPKKRVSAEGPGKDASDSDGGRGSRDSERGKPEPKRGKPEPKRGKPEPKRGKRDAEDGEREPEPRRPDEEEPPERPRRRFGFRRRAQSEPGRARGAGDRDDHHDRDDPGDLRYHDELSDTELDDLPEPPPRLRRPPWYILLGGLIVAVVVVLLFVGEYNTDRYYLVCHGAKAEAHRGRGFPWPFGHRKMTGSRYRPVPLGDEAQCQTQELESEGELVQAMLKLVVTEAERRSRSPREKDLAAAMRLVGQGFLLARNDEKKQARLQVLRAVLDFQQGRAVMRDLEATLLRARLLFVKASKLKTGHGAEAASWILVVDHLLDRLRRRMAGDPKAPERVTATGARPRPAPGADAMSAAPDKDAAPVVPPPRPRPRPTPTPTPAPVIVPDAGVTGGGILL